MQAWIVVGDHIESTSDINLVRQAHEGGRSLWVDLEERTPEGDSLLSDTFNIHPLVVEDVWLDRSVPKLEDFDTYLYIVVHGTRQGSGPRQVDLYVLDIIFGPHYVITQHSKAPTEVHAEAATTALQLIKGIPWLVDVLLDRLVDRYLPLVSDLARQADELELDILRRTATQQGDDMLQAIYELKRSIHKLCRITAYQRNILGRLAHGAYDEIPQDAIPYFRDVHDHFVRVADQVDTYREVVSNGMEAFLSLQSNRMNATMKTLATVSTLMLPLSLIASIYGMNFRDMPELEWRWGYPYALTLMATVGTSLYFWFKHKRWL